MTERDRNRLATILVVLGVVVFLVFWVSYSALQVAAYLKIVFG